MKRMFGECCVAGCIMNGVPHTMIIDAVFDEPATAIVFWCELHSPRPLRFDLDYEETPEEEADREMDCEF